MQKVVKNVKTLAMLQSRAFSAINYSHPEHQRVWMEVAKDGNTQGRMVFELYNSHSPALAENFSAFCDGSAENQKSFVGSTFAKGQTGLGVMGGFIEGNTENFGSNDMRLADENLDMRHHKRGMLTMSNDGANSNGAEFMITFDEANYLNGYNNIIGELVEGDTVLAAIEADTTREGQVHGNWTVLATGPHH